MEVMGLGAKEYIDWVRYLKWESGEEQTDEEIVQSLAAWSR